jgi:hypothetical protein
MGLFSSGKSKSTTTSYLPVQKQIMESFLPDVYGEVQGGPNVYPGQRVAGLTGTQQGLLGGLGAWSQYLQPTTGGEMYGQTGGALSDILAGEMGAEPYTEESVNQLFKSAYEAPARKQWTQETRPEIEEAYSGPGYWSTARMKAVQKGAEDLGDTLSSQYGALRYGAEEANKGLAEAKAGRALSAIPLAGEYISQPQSQALAGIQGTGALYGIAEAEQQQQQNEINAAMQRFAEENQIADPQTLQTLLQLLTANFNTSVQKTTGPGLGASLLGSAAEGLGSAFGGGWGSLLTKESPMWNR